MSASKPGNTVELLEFALRNSLVIDGKLSLAGKYGILDQFADHAIRVADNERAARADAHAEEVSERNIGRASGFLDEGQDDWVGVSPSHTDYSRLAAILGGPSTLPEKKRDSSGSSVPSCFAILCDHFGVGVPAEFHSVSDLGHGEILRLSSATKAKVFYAVYGQDDPRNHVLPVIGTTKANTLQVVVDTKSTVANCTYGITAPQEFFNVGGRFYTTKFYADQPSSAEPVGMSDVVFGGDTSRSPVAPGQTERNRPGTAFSGFNPAANRPQPPESIVDNGVAGGSSNVSGGVTRAKKRVIRAKGAHYTDPTVLKSYTASGVTMFNNVDELYIDTISREFAQEVIEDVFDNWGVPTEQPEAVKYAEDLLFLFLIARTASNKADYNVAYDVPTKSGSIEADFSVFSRLLADKYGITRRNFSRGIANDLRAYLLRPENQFVRSRSADRVDADPQYGDLCFDGSTGCTGMVSSEKKFTRILESRNLYERADVIAEGSSAMLMEGIHGGTRSVVAR